MYIPISEAKTISDLIKCVVQLFPGALKQYVSFLRWGGKSTLNATVASCLSGLVVVVIYASATQAAVVWHSVWTRNHMREIWLTADTHALKNSIETIEICDRLRTAGEVEADQRKLACDAAELAYRWHGDRTLMFDADAKLKARAFALMRLDVQRLQNDVNQKIAEMKPVADPSPIVEVLVGPQFRGFTMMLLVLLITLPFVHRNWKGSDDDLPTIQA